MAFFDQFPTIEYGSKGVAKNILARVHLHVANNGPLNNGTFTAVLPSALRADIVADKYYQQSTFDWLVYLANQVIDPYYDYNQPHEVIEKQIIADHGSLETAQTKIVHWINNWRNDDSTIAVAAFNSLPPQIAQLYDYHVDYIGTIIGYKRKAVDITKTTNKIVSLTLDQRPTAKIDDFAYWYTANNVVGRGQVASINGTSVNINHVIDSHLGSSIKIGSTTYSVVSVDDVILSITNDEVPFYSPVTAYDYAIERNDKLREIKLPPAAFSDQLEQARIAAIQ